MHDKAMMFNKQFDGIKGTVLETFTNQLQEYIGSVNNKAEYGLDD